MQVVSREEMNTRQEYYMRKLKKAIFIYPTDTIYGIGCNALDGRLVDKVRAMKKQNDRPWSVIAPSKEWIIKHCVVEGHEDWLDKLPGPFTLIFKMKLPEEIPRGVTMGKDTLGVRMPNHWISCIVSALDIPIITTSANKTGENYMRAIDDIPPEWKTDLDLVIYDDELAGKPSTLVDLSGEKVDIIER